MTIDDRTAPKNTPWGKPQSCELVAEGIWRITTSSHGGLKLDRERNAKVAKEARRASGWYEEDCDWAIVTLVFPELFTAIERVAAEGIAKDWLPDEYTAITGTTLTAAESRTLRKRAFGIETADKFVVRSAYGSWSPGIPDGMVRVLARRATTGEEANFLVSSAEYATRGECGFAIDEARHHREPPYSKLSYT